MRLSEMKEKTPKRRTKTPKSRKISKYGQKEKGQTA